VKYKGYHHKEECGRITKNGEQVRTRKGHKLGMKRTRKRKKDPPVNGLNVNEDINL
jgi:hypothetical protein